MRNHENVLENQTETSEDTRYIIDLVNLLTTFEWKFSGSNTYHHDTLISK